MNRNDRRVAVAALVVGVLALVGLFLAGGDEEARWTSEPADPPGAAEVTEPHRGHRPPYGAYKPYEAETFPFDPNTADSTQLLRLGLRPWQVRNIYKYRSRGGVYRTKEDFARLYGLTVKDYRRLAPYIRISADYRPAATLVGERKPLERDTVRFPVKIEETGHVVLNTADTTQLKRVPSIGSFYAHEIVRHGQWLGGYVSVDQLDEIEGFPESAKKYFVVEHPAPHKLNVNKLTLAQLRRHPYINYFQAKTIVDYRRLHGPLHSLQDLRLTRDFPPEAISRLEPYVEF